MNTKVGDGALVVSKAVFGGSKRIVIQLEDTATRETAEIRMSNEDFIKFMKMANKQMRYIKKYFGD